jgi:hypothetical protein
MITQKVNLKHTLIEMVQNKNKAIYINCQGQKLIYEFNVENTKYIFPIDISDKYEIGNAIFEKEHNCITLMRYIRKSIEENTIRYENIIDKGDSL